MQDVELTLRVLKGREDSKRKIKEVDAKHLLFLCGVSGCEAAVTLDLRIEWLISSSVVVIRYLIIKVAMMPSFL